MGVLTRQFGDDGALSQYCRQERCGSFYTAIRGQTSADIGRHRQVRPEESREIREGVADKDGYDRRVVKDRRVITEKVCVRYTCSLRGGLRARLFPQSVHQTAGFSCSQYTKRVPCNVRARFGRCACVCPVFPSFGLFGCQCVTSWLVPSGSLYCFSGCHRKKKMSVSTPIHNGSERLARNGTK